MWKRRKGDSPEQASLFKGVLLANFVLFSHVALIFVLAFLAFFSGGVIAYLPWILAAAGVFIMISGIFFWRCMKKQGKVLKDVLKDPSFQNRTIEVSLLGGLASLRVGRPQGPPMIQYEAAEAPRQLQAPGVEQPRPSADPIPQAHEGLDWGQTPG